MLLAVLYLLGFVREPIAVNLRTLGYIKALKANSQTEAQLQEFMLVQPHSRLLLARSAMAKQQYAQALQLLEPVIDTSDPVILETYAELLFLLERYPEALELWFGMGMYNKLEHAANALFADGNAELGIMALQKAYELRPEVYRTNLMASQLLEANKLRGEGQYERAVVLYKSVMEQFPEAVEPVGALAWAYHLMGEEDLAIQTIDQGMLLSAENYAFFMMGGFLYEHSGLVEKALTAYQRALELNPESSDPRTAIERLKGAE